MIGESIHIASNLVDTYKMPTSTSTLKQAVATAC